MTNTQKAKKPTKKDYFNTLLTLKSVQERPELVDFIEHELELLNRKNAGADSEKSAEKRAKRETAKTAIMAEMVEDEKYTITEMLKVLPSCADYSNSGLTSLMTELLSEGKVKREVEKRRPYYSKVV